MPQPGHPDRYEIRIEGVLDERWATWFAGLELTTEGDQTIVFGALSDQSALHGVLARVRDLGLPLISVRRFDIPRETGATDAK